MGSWEKGPSGAQKGCYPPVSLLLIRISCYVLWSLSLRIKSFLCMWKENRTRLGESTAGHLAVTTFFSHQRFLSLMTPSMLQNILMSITSWKLCISGEFWSKHKYFPRTDMKNTQINLCFRTALSRLQRRDLAKEKNVMIILGHVGVLQQSSLGWPLMTATQFKPISKQTDYTFFYNERIVRRTLKWDQSNQTSALIRLFWHGLPAI